MRHLLLTGIIFGLVITNTAWAELRMPYADEQVVQRAALIVIGHAERDTIKFVDHPGAGSHHHLARLTITRIVKGELAEKHLDIVIRYGLMPLATDVDRKNAKRIDAVTLLRPTGPIILADYSGERNDLQIDDLTKDQIWFLRTGEGESDTDPVPHMLGIVDPEDIQPLSLLDYFQGYLRVDSESFIRELFLKDPVVRGRAQVYLAACDLRRIAVDPDLTRRAINAVPYFLSHVPTGPEEAQKVLVSCGKAGGAVLETYFDQWGYRREKGRIMQVWKELAYTESVPRMIATVEQATNWFDGQLKSGVIEPGNLKLDGGEQMIYYTDIYYGISVLTELKATEAVKTVEKAHALWKRIDFRPNPQIVEACESYFKRVVPASSGR
ncbi:MAG: hypothetical protein H7144_04465 [Burkholderiales bacterium]|nr:hypothetical protein [Phycisphaerae bacterium]